MKENKELALHAQEICAFVGELAKTYKIDDADLLVIMGIVYSLMLKNANCPEYAKECANHLVESVNGAI